MTSKILTVRMDAHPDDSHTLARYEATGGYDALRSALSTMTPEQIKGMSERYSSLNYKHAQMKPVLDIVEKVMEKERPDGIILGAGGQTGHTDDALDGLVQTRVL